MLFNMYMQLNVNNLGLKMLMHIEPVNILFTCTCSKCYLCDEYNCSLQLFGFDPLELAVGV